MSAAVERWAARLVYLTMAPFVLAFGLLVDLHDAMVRVATTVCDAFGWDGPSAVDASELLSGIIIVSVCVAGCICTGGVALELIAADMTPNPAVSAER